MREGGEWGGERTRSGGCEGRSLFHCSLAVSMAAMSSRSEEGEPSRAKRGVRRRAKVITSVGRQAEEKEVVEQRLPVKIEPLDDPPPEVGDRATMPVDALKAWLVEAVGRGVASLSQLSLELHKVQASSASDHQLRRVVVCDEALLEGLAEAGATEVDGKVGLRSGAGGGGSVKGSSEWQCAAM